MKIERLPDIDRELDVPVNPTKKIVEVLITGVWRRIRFQDMREGDVVRFRDPISEKVIKEHGGSGIMRAAGTPVSLTEENRRSEFIEASPNDEWSVDMDYMNEEAARPYLASLKDTHI